MGQHQNQNKSPKKASSAGNRTSSAGENDETSGFAHTTNEVAALRAQLGLNPASGLSQSRPGGKTAHTDQSKQDKHERNSSKKKKNMDPDPGKK